MRQLSFASRTARLALAFLLAIVMCAPVSAHAEESAEGASGSAAAGQVNSQVDQASSSEDAGVSSGQVADAADGVDAGEANAASGAASGEEDSSAQALASAPVAAGAVTMQQGAGEAKEYDSLAAALADAADYDYKTNKDTYVITLNENVSESVVVDGKKRVTVDLNGKTLSPVSAGGVALMVRGCRQAHRCRRGGKGGRFELGHLQPGHVDGDGRLRYLAKRHIPGDCQ